MAAGLLALSVVLAACTGDDAPPEEPDTSTSVAAEGDAAPEPATTPTTLESLLPTGPGFQDVHLVVDIEVVADDGSTTSIMGDVLALAAEDLGTALPFGDGAELRPSASLTATVRDADGELLPTIRADTALARLVDGDTTLLDEVAASFPELAAEVSGDLDGADALVIYSTADLSAGTTDVMEGDRFSLDLTPLGSVAVGDQLQVTYGFSRTLPRDGDPAEVTDAAALLSSRWADGAVEQLTLEGTAGLAPAIMVDDTGEVVEGSSLGGYGAKSGKAFDYLPRCLTKARSQRGFGAVACIMIGGHKAAKLSKDAWNPSQGPSCSSPPAGGGPPVSPARARSSDATLTTPVRWSGSAAEVVPVQGGVGPPGGGGFGGGGGSSGGCAGAFGDPHLRTLDGHRYDLQSAGEYVLAASDAGHIVQARFVPRGRRASQTAAIAFELGDVPVHVEPERSYVPRVIVDGEPVELTRGVGLTVGEGADAGLLIWTGPKIVALWPDGTALFATLWTFLSVEIAPSPTARWTGLLGSLDGDPSNDLITRDGHVLAQPADFDARYGTLAPSWRISQAESRFHYEPGESTDTFTVTGHPAGPLALADLEAEERARAEALCAAAGIGDPQSFVDCILDVAVTGDEEFIASAALSAGARTGQASVTVIGLHGLAGWTTSGGVEPSDGVVDGRGRLLTRLVDAETGEAALLALDAVDAVPAARWDGVVGSCVPGVDADGRTWFQTTDDAGAVALAVVDSTTDEVVDTFVPARDVRMDACRAPIAARAGGGVIVVHRGGFTDTVEAFMVSDGTIASLWRTTFDDLGGVQASIAPDGGIIALTGTTGDVRRVVLVDASDGAVLDTADLPAASPSRAGILATDGLVVVSNADGRYAGTVHGFDVTGGTLEEVWATATDEAGLVEAPIGFVAAEELLVSWYPIADRLVALRASDGEVVWEHAPVGFARTQRLAAGPDGVVYLLPSGGGVQAVAPDGTMAWYAGVDLGMPTFDAIGPLDAGGRLHAFSRGSGDDPPRWWRLRPGAGGGRAGAGGATN